MVQILSKFLIKYVINHLGYLFVVNSHNNDEDGYVYIIVVLL